MSIEHKSTKKRTVRVIKDMRRKTVKNIERCTFLVINKCLTIPTRKVAELIETREK